MKFNIAALLLGASTAVNIEAEAKNDVAIPQECLNTEEKIDEASLLDYMEHNDIDLLNQELLDDSQLDDEQNVAVERHVAGTAKRAYGKSWKQINAENRHILSTQAKCLRFVRKHPGHQAVCNYCKKQKTPKVIWKWDSSQKVWYRWSLYNRRWMYWGPSKRGFTASGWSWYRGFWHHGGFVYQFRSGKWWRYENRRWVVYKKRVEISPKLPRTSRYCRNFYVVRRAGVSATLAAKVLPRCRVGKTLYMWQGSSACRFLGGKYAVVKRHTCHRKGRNDYLVKVRRCVYEPRVSGAGLFSGAVRKMHLTNRAKISINHKTYARQVKQLLNSRSGTRHQLNYRRGKDGSVKVRFNSPANLAGLGIRGGGASALDNPNYVHIVIRYKDSRGRSRKSDVVRTPRWPSNKAYERRLWTGSISNVFEVDYFFKNSRRKSVRLTELTFYHQKGSRLPRAVRKVIRRGRVVFDSNKPPGGLSKAASRTTTASKRGVKTYTFTGGWRNWKGAAIKALPDRNFEITLQFQTRQKKCGFFELHGKGHDRHMGLKNGRPYVRVWKGRGYTITSGRTYNDGRWHTMRLRVVTGQGQRVYIDNKLVMTNRYDHSDYHWKTNLRIGYSSDLGSFHGKLKNVRYYKLKK